ncbi:phage portal protein [Henriciella sp.]|uniref:anti-CBASS protein Acb1 family protein n=1 Tax=Henriciella sp. TaxID=1968823 RepID=UPI000C0F4E4B|nr:anti-CBASS Acb1 family protein [Henriciella sp.]PHR83110.1 MAG: DUF1073 domain-containing protein [Henriciella sp.]
MGIAQRSLTMIANRARSLQAMFPGYFANAKHNHYRDFGFPETITFDQFHAMYARNGIACAAVEKTAGKTWQSFPFLMEGEEKDAESRAEGDIRQRFDDLRLWQKVKEADLRSMVGGYSGLILRLADSKKFNQPVDRVPGGLMGLVEVIPAWEGQLTVSQWDSDETSETYGQPLMFNFTEYAVDSDKGSTNQKNRSFELHPDRVIIWSRDGTVHNRSMLEPGFNDLMTLEKVIGAGGEGFWKNAKAAPVLETDKEIDLADMAKGMGVSAEDLHETMSDQVEDWQKGFDALLWLQGMQAKSLQVSLPIPEHFVAVALQSFAASFGIPLKILVGSQTGERASTEDANEWAQTCMSRREGQTIPNIMALVNRLEAFGILPERDWSLDWADLTEASMAEKFDLAMKMAEINAKLSPTGELAFLQEEIRARVGFEPLSPEEAFRGEPDDDEAAAALGLDPEPIEPDED